MGLTKYKLGELIELSDERNTEGLFHIEDVRGISNSKEIMRTKADVDQNVIKKFYVVRPGQFIYNPRTTRMGDRVGLAYNDQNKPLLFSFNNIAFAIKESARNILLPHYLYIYFNRSEFDRYAITNSWGSATELFSFEEMCDITISLPDKDIQQKYVDIYLAMQNNLAAYQSKVEELKLVCDGYIEDLRRDLPCEPIEPYLRIRNEQNREMIYNEKDVLGVSQDKSIIPTKSDTKGNDLSKFTIVYPNDFIYNPRNGIAIGLNKISAIISWNNTAFYIKDNSLLPEYLMMWFSRYEWDRKVKFDSWGSSTEVYSYDALCSTKIPIPTIEIQRSIVNMYNCYTERQRIAETLKEQLRNICPVLIRGSLEE